MAREQETAQTPLIPERTLVGVPTKLEVKPIKVEEPSELDKVLVVTGAVLAAEFAARFQIMHVRNEAAREVEATRDYFNKAMFHEVTGPDQKELAQGIEPKEASRIQTTEGRYAAMEYAYSLKKGQLAAYAKEGNEEHGKEIATKAADFVKEAFSESADPQLRQTVIPLAEAAWHLYAAGELGDTAAALSKTPLSETIAKLKAKGTLTDEEAQTAYGKIMSSLPMAGNIALKGLSTFVPFGKEIEKGIHNVIEPLSENEKYIDGLLTTEFADVIQGRSMSAESLNNSWEMLTKLENLGIGEADLNRFTDFVAAEVLIQHVDALVTVDAGKDVPADLGNILQTAQVCGLLDARQPNSSSLILSARSGTLADAAAR